MVFYKAEFVFNENLSEQSDKLITKSEYNTSKLRTNAETFLMNQNKVRHIAISNINDHQKQMSLCVVNDKYIILSDLQDMLCKFVLAIGFSAKEFDIQEITFDQYHQMICNASNIDYIGDTDIFYKKLGVSELRRFVLKDTIQAKLKKSRGYKNYDPRFSENVLKDELNIEELHAKADGLLCDNSLRDELERINKGSRQKGAGHPVHYMLRTDEETAENHIINILLSTLHQNERIKNRRYSKVQFDGGQNFPEEGMAALYEASSGGTIVITFNESDIGETEYANTSMDFIINICALMQEYRHEVLTVFCLPRKAEKTNNIFSEQLDAITIITISQEAVFGKRAEDYLRAKAKKSGLKVDKLLLKNIITDKGYSSYNLNLIFDEWYDKRLKTKVYTQYADFRQ
jgi:hypothetical protein